MEPVGIIASYLREKTDYSTILFLIRTYSLFRVKERYLWIIENPVV